MNISKEDVLHIAHLARLSLTKREVEYYYQDGLKKILDSMEELKEIETDDVELFLNPIRETGHRPSERIDKVEESLHQSLVLENAPDGQYGQFKLEAVMESES